jgi:hypothetical protein
MENENVMECHACGDPAYTLCDGCGQPVCEKCMIPFTIHNQIDFPQCEDCEEYHTEQRILEIDRDREYEDKKRVKREKINTASRRRYHSPAQKEKRRLAKIEKRRKSIEFHERFWKTMTQGFDL